MEAMSELALRMLESAHRLYLRTGHHPAAEELANRGLHFETFDSIYETASSFDEVYGTIAGRLIEEAKSEDITYAVPGHPLVAERSVAILIERAKEAGIAFRFAGSSSLIEACLEALAVPIGRGLKLIDALALDDTPPSPECPNLIYQVYDRMIASSVKLALMNVYPDEFEVYIATAAGGTEEKVEKLPLYELDRRDFYHLTSVFVPELGDRDGDLPNLSS
jgi:tetrapyrrole methylase family protein/MazG family protein